jgi:putative ABC transport system substrate-binding protein
MRRREFITLLGNAAVAGLPCTAHAQQSSTRRRIAVLFGGNVDNQEIKSALAAFQQGLHQLGWVEGQNLRSELRRGEGDEEKIRKHAGELAALAPDVIVTIGSSTMRPLLRATRTVPIVFVFVPDPLGSGFVKSMSRPGGNATGFMAFEYSLSAKWLELLKQIAPGVQRAAVLWDPDIPAGIGQFAVIQSVAPSFGVEVIPVNLREVEQDLAAFVRAGGGLIVTASGMAVVQRELIVSLAARHKLPTVYNYRGFVDAGGLISYGPDLINQFRLAASYVDRILKGEKPADLPVQAPTKYELVINLKAAKALGVELPPTLLTRADEVIE